MKNKALSEKLILFFHFTVVTSTALESNMAFLNTSMKCLISFSIT